MSRKNHLWDCLIVGGGPAGLTAAIYLARFHLEVLVVDSGQSRSRWIPKTHNHSGFPEGISGEDLLSRMRQQAEHYRATVKRGRISTIVADDGNFAAGWGEGSIMARTVLLATGVVDRRPEMEEALHAEALANGRLRYCPICDGFEVTDQKIAVIGTGAKGVEEALFLRSFSADVSLVSPHGAHELDDEQQKQAEHGEIALVDGPSKIEHLTDIGIAISTNTGEMLFDTVYPALGSDINNMLAKMLGARCSETGCLIVDAHQRTSVAGLYAAGDVVIGLDQISHAMGNGSVAATAIRNDLAERRSLFR